MRHLVCDPFSVDGLHTMARELGVKRCWYHPGTFPHYDIPKRRIAEIRRRTTVVSPREILETIKRGA
jgi:hypothetical protein